MVLRIHHKQDKHSRALPLAIRIPAVSVLVLIAAEVALALIPRSLIPQLRLIDRVYSARAGWQQLVEGDEYLGHHLRPNIDIDFPSEGRSIRFRTRDFGLGAIGLRDLGSEARFDILVVGDSFAVCDDVPVEACWVRTLAELTGKPAATLGVNGYSTTAAYRSYERYGSRLSPGLVLATVYPNDFRDNVVFDKWKDSGSDDLWLWQGERRSRSPVSIWLGQHLRLFRFVDGVRRGLGREIYFHRDDGLDLVFRFDPWFVDVVRNGNSHPGWLLMRRDLRALHDLALAQGASFAVILFPTKEQVYRDLLGSRGPADVRAGLLGPNAMVASFCRDAMIPYCDLTAGIHLAAADGPQLYHRISSHLNDAGNQVSARLIRSCLEEQGLIEKGAFAQ